MGVKAPQGIQRFYYVAYPTGLIVGFVVYYLTCLASTPPGMKEVSGWMEPKDYIEDEDLERSHGFAIDALEITPGLVEKGAVSVIKESPGETVYFSRDKSL